MKTSVDQYLKKGFEEMIVDPMMKFSLTFSILLFSSSLFSQSTYKQFQQLSKPEKCWVITHPFVAKRTFVITQKVLLTVDSIKQTGIIGTDNNGGKLDAFKHTYWMASLSANIGLRKAFKLGKAHEKGNYLQYKKHQLEENMLPDSVSSAMDLKNNEYGVHLGVECKNTSQKIIAEKILNALNEGELTIIKKDKQGNFLTCDNTVLAKEWIGKWNIPKCLIASNYNQ
jgi:hypothetical protein